MLDIKQSHVDNAGCHHWSPNVNAKIHELVRLNRSRRGGVIKVLAQSDISGVELFRRGKVRDVYAFADKLLIVATDRISAFDVILPSAIPYKGAVLTALSLFWFDLLSEIVPNHFISADVYSYPDRLQDYRDQLEGRSMLVHRAEIFPIECVARGYLAGSGWKDYRKAGEICGVRLPAGLKESEKLPEPIFTPTTKAEAGHDLSLTEREVADRIGYEAASTLKQLTLSLYRRASDYAEDRGIIIADTKFEFGLYEGNIILADEALTPDSSRFWPKISYEPGKGQRSFDKQYVRDYLETLDWNKQPPGPELPQSIIARTSEKYLEAYRLLTGAALRIADSGFQADRSSM
jgi:phosphoribosylaminoimidazole-succinocarboxamide synthase